MTSAKKVGAIVAGVGAGALGLSLIGMGGGVGAQFTDAGTANAHLAVGSFSCTLSSSDSAVTISPNGHTASVTFPTINSSAAGSDSAPLTVTNSGTMPLKVNWTVTDHGTIFNSGRVTSLPVTSGLAINSGNARTYDIGFQWSELQNVDLNTNGYVTYSASCVEPTSVSPNFTLWQQDGGTATFANNVVTLTMPASPSTAAAGVTLSNTSATLPTTAPTFATDAYAAGSPRWLIYFADGSYVWGYPSQGGKTWEEKNPTTTSGYVQWPTVLTDHQSGLAAQVTEVDIVMDMDQTSTTAHITCIDYGATQQLGSGGSC